VFFCGRIPYSNQSEYNMKQVISNQAQIILAKKENEYWVNNKAIITDAVDFGDEAFRLAGPFDDKYGLVYIFDYSKEVKPFLELLESSKNKCFETTTWMPHSIKEKVERTLGNPEQHYFYSEFWFNKELKKSLSDIDIEAGANTEGYVCNGEKCGVFFSSKEGLEKVKSILTEEEYLSWENNINEKVKSWYFDMKDTSPCSERPYLMRVQGTDDCSFSKTYESFDECIHALNSLKQFGFKYIDEKMRFTN